jgi:flagella basal body P-ring formation protein FlgA
MNRNPSAMRNAHPPLALAVAMTAALIATTPLAAQSALPPAQDLGQLERMVVASVGADIGMPGGPMAPIDRRMRLAACPGAIQIDPPSASSVTVRCTTSGWRVRVPLMRDGMATNPGTAATAGGYIAASADAAVRKGDPVQLVAQGSAFSISIDATAMEDAAIGRRVRVATTSKGSTLFAEVIDVGQVRLIGFK